MCVSTVRCRCNSCPFSALNLPWQPSKYSEWASCKHMPISIAWDAGENPATVSDNRIVESHGQRPAQHNRRAHVAHIQKGITAGATGSHEEFAASPRATEGDALAGLTTGPSFSSSTPGMGLCERFVDVFIFEVYGRKIQRSLGRTDVAASLNTSIHETLQTRVDARQRNRALWATPHRP